MKDKVVVITGGSSGIGKALAEEFGKNGSRILITGRNKQELDGVVDELLKKGIVVAGFQADVSREEDNQKMADEAIRKYGKIDILINNAGINMMRMLVEDLAMDIMRKVMDINYFGVVYATRACLPEIIRNKGSVIGISSIAGFRGLPAQTGYSSSKFALNGFLEVLRTEMLKRHVHVMTACPGFTQSNIRKRMLTKDGSQGDSPRDEADMMSAEECARHIYRATVKRKNILILTTQGKMAVFLNKWLPGLADKLVYNTMAKEPNSPLK